MFIGWHTTIQCTEGDSLDNYRKMVAPIDLMRAAAAPVAAVMGDIDNVGLCPLFTGDHIV